eukprot:CAMPEP_0117430548 /NCGR_PEP_ID=MMETSP0758-20121206/10092_1 /TAXON_ID=63605 /ORGANISM="Percolomonas cosmopolitus, Strain AE-1 (ATCC 50343)" /LENGTH=205 /DNA_ID=CAMNT_0005218687 /DNA_START=69 /DNA_END=686 /DNA_ORIENTATION=-
MTNTKETLSKIEAYVNKLLADLNPDLRYHGRHHTIDIVYPAAMKLCDQENVTDEERLIVGASALFHDTGFLDQYEKNEPMGAERAATQLKQFGFTDDQIKIVKECIMATQLPQSPGDNKLAQIVCDADVSSIGSDDFFITSETLRQELNLVKQLGIRPRKWHEGNTKFLQNHTYFTESAKKHLQPIKERNMKDTLELLGVDELPQ